MRLVRSNPPQSSHNLHALPWRVSGVFFTSVDLQNRATALPPADPPPEIRLTGKRRDSAVYEQRPQLVPEIAAQHEETQDPHQVADDGEGETLAEAREDVVRVGSEPAPQHGTGKHDETEPVAHSPTAAGAA
jgi:hypothetical protein